MNGCDVVLQLKITSKHK